LEPHKNIAEATKEIFETMIMMEVAADEPLKEKVETFRDSVSGMIGLAGVCQGLLAIHIPNEVAKAITGNFLGLEVDEINEDVTDAIGELANMLAGSIKMALSENGKNITLSIPSAIYGDEYTVSCLADADWVTVPFSVPQGQFLVTLEMKKSA
jgi:chemotaxis protein CheX